jgi:DNA excision repair protein ERCC-2
MNKDYLKYFPDYKPYPNQITAMEAIEEALINKQIFLFEGACGTGKTLSALIPAISVAKDLKKLVVIATNVNEQKEQFITEAKAIRDKAQLKIIAMTAKDKICYQNNIHKKEVEDKTDYDACEKMRDAGECKPYNQVKGLSEKEEDDDNAAAKEAAVLLGIAFENWVFSSVRTPDEIGKWGVEHNACVYTLVLKALSSVDVVICDLRIILNIQFMQIFEKFTGKSLQDMIIIFDEAHNIEKVAKSVYERGISQQTLVKGRTEIDTIFEEMKKGHEFELDKRQLERSQEFIKSVLLDSLMGIEISDDHIKKVTNRYEGSEIQIADPDKPYHDRPDELAQRIINHVEDVGGEQYLRTNLDILGDIGQKYQEKCKNDDPEHESRSNCTTIADFFKEYLDISKQNGYYPYLSIRKNDHGDIIRRVNIHLSLPKIVTAPILNEVFAGVLMSATLEPFDTLKKVLGISRETVELTVGLQFPIDNRRTYVVTRDARNNLTGAQQKFAPDILVSENDKNPASIKYIQESLESVIDGSNKNVLIYFKTKVQAAQYYYRLKEKYGHRVLLNNSSDSSSEVKNIFYRMGRDGERGILCTYLGGTLAEGVDFRDDRARTVVVVGIGYTYKSLLIKADETAYNVGSGTKDGWYYVVKIPTIRKIRQALGRVVRSDKDYGIRVLLDARYNKNTSLSVFREFPEDERREFMEVHAQYLKNTVIEDFKLFTK